MEQRDIEDGTEPFQFLREHEKQAIFGPGPDCDDDSHGEALSEGDSVPVSGDGQHDVALYEAGRLREDEEVVADPAVASENDDDDDDEALYEVEVVYGAIRCRDIERSLEEDKLAKYM
ncbi:hypothetical protein DL769_000720 [Monosporascus sp. CRB-8-3]|nr:hypothetical protein DL769_000720 [Monosporascus sp. CRB-8-3]